MNNQSLSVEEFTHTVKEINAWYGSREQDSGLLNQYAPFQEIIVGTRCKQYVELARFFQQRDILSLKGMRILDVGCGEGHQVRRFLDYGADPEQICGVEIRSSCLEVARKLSPHVRWQMYDGVNLPFQEGEFDLVTQHVVISSVLSARLRQHLAAEMWRVLARNGFVFWWDTLVTQGPSPDVRGKPLRLDLLFDGVPREERLVSSRPHLDDLLQLSGWRTLLRPLLRQLRPEPEFCAALIGPKAG